MSALIELGQGARRGCAESFDRLERVAEAANRSERRAASVELAANPPDENVERRPRGFGRVTPDRLHEDLARHDATPHREDFNDRHLLRGEGNTSAADADAPSLEVHDNRPDDNGLVTQDGAAATERPHTRDELGEGERLHQVV